MAVLKALDDKEMILSCKCGCDEGIRIQIVDEADDYCYQTYLSGNWCKEQSGILKKIRKIWAILRNKDYYYSEIILSKQEWEEYKKWINRY